MTHCELKDALDYNESTGIFTWKISPMSKVKSGSVAGTIRKIDGYIHIQYKGKIYKGHRLAWFFVYGVMPLNQIDHIDHNGSNNAISNLREVDNSLNQRNGGFRSDNTSGFVGIYWHKKRNSWCAKLTVNGKNIHIGWYRNKEDAIKARKDANRQFGFHENHGLKNA